MCVFVCVYVCENKNKTTKKTSFSTESAPIAIFCLVTETKGWTFHGILGFYLTSGIVDYMAVIISAHLVSVKSEVFTAASTMKIQLHA